MAAPPIRRFFDYLTRPSPRVPAEQRGRARITAALVLISMPAMLMVSTWGWLGAPLQALLLFSPLILIIAYFLNRAGYVRLAPWLGVVFFTLVPFVYLITLQVYVFETITFGVIWLMAPLFICYVLLDLRDLTIALLLNVAVVFTVLVFKPQITLNILSIGLLILLWTAALLLVASMLRQQDAQELKMQTRAHGESESRYRTLFAAAMEGIIIHKDGRVIDCNPAFAELLGYSQEELPGMSALDFYAPEERERAVDLIKSTDPYEAQGIRKDGTRFWAEVRGRPMIVEGQLVRVATLSDITQRRKAEQQRVSLAVEREKVEILQRFITNVSHDLRTPLSTINTGLYLIEKVKDDPARLQAQLASVQAQVQHLDRLIDDLLSMSRLDRRQTGEYAFAWHTLNTLVRAAIDELASQTLRKRQTLDFDGGDGLPMALVDKAEFRRMLRHLIQNAINFTPEGGEVRVSTAHEGEEIVISIHDNGIGIAAEDRAAIFDYFYRVDEARSPDNGGTGLGLTIAKRICEAHNGRIEVDSEPGEGSTFRVRLPITRRTLPEVTESKEGV
ncbi:MAG TPA: ATP-binding protein [Candidatus Limnocylindrales bacterium]|nr:ATP-binding protein [Candidatus Limnocylindrales bacterium]